MTERRIPKVGDRVAVHDPARRPIGRGTIYDLVTVYIILSEDGKTYRSPPNPEEYPPDHMIPFDRDRLLTLKGCVKIELDDYDQMVYGSQVYWNFLPPEQDDPSKWKPGPNDKLCAVCKVVIRDHTYPQLAECHRVLQFRKVNQFSG